MLKSVVLASIISLGLVPVAGAVPISYTVNLGTTINGANPLTVAILEFDGVSQTSFDYGFDVYPIGVQTISHEATFQPSQTLIVGIDYAVPGDLSTQSHVVFFVDPAFYDLAIGHLFNYAFTGGPRYRDFRPHVENATNGDLAEQAWLLDWAFGVSAGDEAGALGGSGLTALGVGLAFATDGPSIGIEYSNGGPVSAVPEPASLLLFGTGLALVGARRRRKRQPTA